MKLLQDLGLRVCHMGSPSLGNYHINLFIDLEGQDFLVSSVMLEINGEVLWLVRVMSIRMTSPLTL